MMRVVSARVVTAATTASAMSSFPTYIYLDRLFQISPKLLVVKIAPITGSTNGAFYVRSSGNVDLINGVINHSYGRLLSVHGMDAI